MKILEVLKTEWVKIKGKEKRDFLEEHKDCPIHFLPSKEVELAEPKYIVEMSASEFQLVSFYLELEKRKPIMNVNIDVEKGE